MGEKAIKFAEHIFFTMTWVVIVLILAGYILHLANKQGILPGVTSWIGQHTDLASQAGGN